MSLPERRDLVPDLAPPTTAFRPFIPAEVKLPELTVLPVIVGALLGAIFGASSLYLVLKVGLTVSASIPVAVISITLFRLLRQDGRPGRHDPREQHRADGRVGGRVDRVRRRRHDAGDPDPGLRPGDHAGDPGRAARRPARHPDDDPAAARPDRRAARQAQVSRGHGLRRGAQGRGHARGSGPSPSRDGAGSALEATGLGARTIFAGFGIGLLYKTAMAAFKTWKDIPEKVFGAPLKAGSVAAGDLARAARRGLHHRPAHRLGHVRRAACSPTWC